MSSLIWLNNNFGFCYRFEIIRARMGSIWKICTAAPSHHQFTDMCNASINYWAYWSLDRRCVHVLPCSVKPQHMRTSFSAAPFCRSLKGAAWCGCRDHSDSFRWRTLLIVYLSAKAFHHFWCLRASCFNRLGRVRKGAAYASQSSASYFILLHILNKKTAFDLSD